MVTFEGEILVIQYAKLHFSHLVFNILFLGDKGLFESCFNNNLYIANRLINITKVTFRVRAHIILIIF